MFQNTCIGGDGLNFLHRLKFIKEVNPRTELGLDIKDTCNYEFVLQTTNRHVVRRDYQLLTTSYGRNFYFDLSCLFSSCSKSNKKKFNLPNSRFSYAQLQLEFKKDGLITNEEKEIKK